MTSSEERCEIVSRSQARILRFSPQVRFNGAHLSNRAGTG